jgi:hypothetical protein
MPDLHRADVQVLTEETVKLLRMNVADLYATLGGQLPGAEAPSKVAGIMSYLACPICFGRESTPWCFTCVCAP